MSFKVLVDPGDGGPFQVVHEIEDRRVTRVSLQGKNGEAGVMNVAPDQTECLLVFEMVTADHRPTLQDVDEMRHPTLTGDQVQERVDALAELPTATNTGTDVLLAASEEAAARRDEEQQLLEQLGEAQRAQEELREGEVPGEEQFSTGDAPDADFDLGGSQSVPSGDEAPQG